MASDRENEKTDELYQSVVPVLPDKYKIARHASHQVLNDLGLEPFEVQSKQFNFFQHI